MPPKRGKSTGSKDPPAKRTRGQQKAAQDPDDDDDLSGDLPLIKIASPTKPKYWKRNFDQSYG